MLVSKPVSVSLLVCDAVLTEADGGFSAIRIKDVLHCARASPAARFFVITYLHSVPGDILQHVLEVRMTSREANGSPYVVAHAPEQRFIYGYRVDSEAPGGFVLTTEFNLDLMRMGNLGTYFIQAFLDGEIVAQTPLTLRWLG
jgi:hypothetical protein